MIRFCPPLKASENVFNNSILVLCVKKQGFKNDFCRSNCRSNCRSKYQKRIFFTKIILFIKVPSFPFNTHYPYLSGHKNSPLSGAISIIIISNCQPWVPPTNRLQ